MFKEFVDSLQPTDEILTLMPFIIWIFILLVYPEVKIWPVITTISVGFISAMNQIEKNKRGAEKRKYKKALNNSRIFGFIGLAVVSIYVASFIVGLTLLFQILSNKDIVYLDLVELASLQFIGFAIYWTGFLLISSLLSLLIMDILAREV